MRGLAIICILGALGSCKEDVYFIPGTGTLPDCNDTPATNLDGTLWFDQGTVLTYAAAAGDAPAQMSGTLVVQGSCRAEYQVTFGRVNDPSAR